jgi:hypothetical protein
MKYSFLFNFFKTKYLDNIKYFHFWAPHVEIFKMRSGVDRFPVFFFYFQNYSARTWVTTWCILVSMFFYFEFLCVICALVFVH